MTAQIPDLFRLREHEYSLVGISEGELFHPSLLDLNPFSTITACWRGYQAVFAVSETRLVLDTLHINLLIPDEGEPRQEGPVINGVKPTRLSREHDWFNYHYEGIDYPLEYTGGLLLGDGFISELYVHMGFHPAWKYETVIELIFDSGILIQELDRSAQMAEIRKKELESQAKTHSNRPSTRKEIVRFIKRAFDRSYRR